MKNGALVAEADNQFDVLITGDRNLSFQQDVATRRLSVIVLHAPSTQLHHTLPLMPKVPALLPKLKPGEVVNVYP